MSRKTQSSNFDVSVHQNKITVSQFNSRIEFTPAEADKLCELLGVAYSAGSGGVRGYLQSTPFRVLYNKEGEGRQVIRQGMQPGEGLNYVEQQTDALILTVRKAIQINADDQRHAPRSNPTIAQLPDPLIEG